MYKVVDLFGSLLHKLWEQLFPPQCYGCGQLGSYLCRHCLKKPYIHPEICPFCHAVRRGFLLCATCRSRAHPLEGVLICFGYVGIIKRMFQAFKYGHRSRLASFFGERMAVQIFLHQSFYKKDIVVCNVPSHWSTTHYRRLYTPSTLIAQSLNKILQQKIQSFQGDPTLRPHSCSFVPLLIKPTLKPSQLTFARNERRLGPKDSFVVDNHMVTESVMMKNLGSSSDKDDNRIFLIVDDLFTTGSTLVHAAQALLPYIGNSTIWGIVVGRNWHLDNKMRQRLYRDGRS